MPTSHLLEIHPNIIHPSTPRSTQWSLSLRFLHQDPIHTGDKIEKTKTLELNILWNIMWWAEQWEEDGPLMGAKCLFVM
jgi:hypothetical protein